MALTVRFGLCLGYFTAFAVELFACIITFKLKRDEDIVQGYE